MGRTRRKVQPKELVRLTPGQFSALVALIVLLSASSLLAGYILGVKTAQKQTETGEAIGLGAADPVAPPKEPTTALTGDQADMTFYKRLTDPKEGRPRTPPPAAPKPEAAPPRSEAPPENLAVPSVGGSVMVQVASYQETGRAQKLLSELRKAGYSGSVVRADLGPRGIWHRVQLGPYSDPDGASRALRELEATRSLKGFIVR